MTQAQIKYELTDIRQQLSFVRRYRASHMGALQGRLCSLEWLESRLTAALTDPHDYLRTSA